MKRAGLMACVLALQTGLVAAGTFPGSITREPLVRTGISDRLSIGASYDRIHRGTDLLDVDLEADAIRAYLGYDALPWLTVFFTAGGSSLRGDTWSSTDYEPGVSAGLQAYLWQGDVLSPVFAAGRFSIKAMLEVGRYGAESSLGSSDWMELVAALPIGYEMFDPYPAGRAGVSTSLALYAGPAVSYLDGDLAVLPGRSASFTSDQELGALAGADIYFAPSVSIGAHALVMDEVSYGATMRFHF